MSEDIRQKEKRLRKELAKARAELAAENRKVTRSRDFSVGGVDPNTSHKATHAGADIPDVVLLPKKKRQRKENIPW